MPELDATDELVARVVDEFRERRARGETPDPEEYTTRHPEVAPLLRRVLATFRLLGPAAAAPDPPPSAEPIPHRLGDYRLVREVGRGGMGVVYEAEQLSLARRVALKVLPLAAVMDPRHLQRFRSEALAAAALDHPHAVKVYAVGCERGVNFIALQFVDGRTLADLIRERRGGTPTARGEQDSTRTLTADATGTPAHAGASSGTRADGAYVRRVAEWGAQAAEALEHAHSLGVVHRDVKPGNLLVDRCGELFVADFGLARVPADAGVTGTGDLLGTPRYMSPEQAAARHNLVDHRSDVYSLGATLYELLTLTPAFDGRDRQEVIHRVLHEDPAQPRSIDRGVPRDLETVVLKAMEKNPARRYPSARELAEDLRRFLAGKPVEARRATLLDRAGKWSRRHPTTLAAVVSVLAVSVLGLVVGLAAVGRERDQTAEALDRERDAREQAQKRLAQLQKSVEILSAVFHDLDPRAEERGKPLRRVLLERLERAVEELQGETVGDPLVVARLQATLGRSLTGWVETEKVLKVLQPAEATLKAVLGDDHPETLTARHYLAGAYQGVGRLDLAIPLFETTLKTREAKLGVDHTDTIVSRIGLAGAYQSAGRRDLAVPLYERSLAVAEAKLGRDHQLTLFARNNLATIYQSAGRLDLACPLVERNLRAAESVYGEDHANTLVARTNLAWTYMGLGRRELAIPLFERVFRAWEAKMGPDDGNTLFARSNLGQALREAGMLDRAIPHLEQTLKIRRAKFPDTHNDTLQSLERLAMALLAAGRTTDARPHLQAAVNAFRKRYSPADPEFANQLARIGTELLRDGHPAEAEPLLRECLNIREKVEPDGWRTFNARALLGGALLGLKKYADAEPLLLTGYDGMRKREGTIPPAARENLPDAATRLIALYTALGKPDEAAKWRVERGKYPSDRAPYPRPVAPANR